MTDGLSVPKRVGEAVEVAEAAVLVGESVEAREFWRVEKLREDNYDNYKIIQTFN